MSSDGYLYVPCRFGGPFGPWESALKSYAACQITDAGLALANLTITGGMALIDDPVLRRLG
jgi:hypothetical protein